MMPRSVGWDLHPLDRHHHRTGQQTGGEAAEEARVDGEGDGTADEAGDETGPVRHAVRDVAGEYRDQEGEGDGADLEEQRGPAVGLCPDEVVRDGLGTGDLVAADGERRAR